MIIKENILLTVGDLANDFMYYDRKEDESLPVGAIEDALAKGDISVEEIVAKFRESIRKLYNTTQ